MPQTLRHRLGHPVETALELLGGKWKNGLLANLKERLLSDAQIRRIVAIWSSNGGPGPSAKDSGGDRQDPTHRRGNPARLSREAKDVMQLYVVRHGIAVDSSDGLPDEWRPLTEKGRRRFQKAARAFGNLSRRVDLILTSPLVRAVQTAEILAGETKHDEVAVLAELDPKFDVGALRTALARRAGEAEAVAIVGHEPQLSAMLSALSGVPQEEIDLVKGAIVRVDVSTLTDGAAADARWWLKPKGSRKKGLPLRKPAEEPATVELAQASRTSKKSRQRKQKGSMGSAESGADDDQPEV